MVTFLQYVVICGVIPVMSLYLKEIPLISGAKVGIILSMSTAAGILSPLITVYIADRYISAEKLFAICNIAASFLLLLLRQQSEFLPVLFIYLFLMMFITPSAALINIMVFNFLGAEGRRFGSIRVWGTLGWIFMSLFFSYVWLGDVFFKNIGKSIGDILYFSSVTALFLGLFSLSIRSEKKEFKKRNTGLSLFGKDPSTPDRRRLYVFFLISLFISVVDKYYYMGLSPYLKYSGVPDK
ncbi:MAG: MFS transporter, partial [Spirochaetia bacterium]|nr:MFS transporter [Spirochaetia bacterium]